MTQRTQARVLLGFAVLGVLLLLAPTLRAADPTPLSCPNGQTIVLQGRAPAREALLVYLAGRAVGGGLADGNGTYSLPLRAQERPGSYPVEVRLRSNRSVVERFVCFVDVPIGEETPTPTAATAGPQPTSPAAGTTPASRGTASATRTAGTAVATTRTPSGSPTMTPTGPTATASTTRTAGPSPTATSTLLPGQASPTRTPTAESVEIIDVVLADPAFPNDEYVSIENTSDEDVVMTGWRLVNASRSSVPAFAFPTFTLEVDGTAAVYSGSGNLDLVAGNLYWGQSQMIWRVGDRVELRDAQNNLIDSFVVLE